MARDKYSTWNRQTWHSQKMVPYKNDTPCEKISKGGCWIGSTSENK